MTAFSIIIPAYNEEKGIAKVIDAIRALPLQTEIIVVDDGSTDATGDVAKAKGAIVLRHPINAGYGKSLKDGILAASNDVIAITDADGTYPIDAIPALLKRFEESFDMVVGARTGAAYRGLFLKMPARFAFQFLVEFTTGRSIPDINSGLRIFRKSQVAEYFADICNGFSFTTTITLIYMLTGKLVSYEPIVYHHRIGRSKVRMVRDSFRTLQYIVESIANYNPLKLFMLLSLLLFACAVGFSLGWWLTSDSVLSIPAMLAFGMGVGVFGLGLVADVLRKHR